MIYMRSITCIISHLQHRIFGILRPAPRRRHQHDISLQKNITRDASDGHVSCAACNLEPPPYFSVVADDNIRICAELVHCDQACET